jgi:hypothetical protein
VTVHGSIADHTIFEVRVLEVAHGADGRFHVAIETTEVLVACEQCGVRAQVEGRDRVSLVDLPAFGSPVRPVWVKRRWRSLGRAGRPASALHQPRRPNRPGTGVTG